MRDVLIFVHGMMPLPRVTTHAEEYDRLFAHLLAHPTSGSRIRAAIPDASICRVEWGHPIPDGGDTPDAHIEAAENTIAAQSVYAFVERDKSPHNHLHVSHEGIADWAARQTVRPIFRNVKEGVAML